MAIVGSGPLLERIKNTKLVNLYAREDSLIASSLWATQPVFIHVVRRPGCKLCRNQAADLNALRPEFDRRGIKLIAISHQDNSAQEFAEKHFGSKELYLDASKDFYKTIWDGKIKTKGPAGFFNIAFWRNYKAAGSIEGNMKGDGYHMGGLLLLAKGDGGVQWIFKEENFGDRPSKDQIINAIDALVPMDPKTLPPPAAAAPAANAAPANSASQTPAAGNNNATKGNDKQVVTTTDSAKPDSSPNNAESKPSQ